MQSSSIYLELQGKLSFEKLTRIWLLLQIQVYSLLHVHLNFSYAITNRNNRNTFNVSTEITPSIFNYYFNNFHVKSNAQHYIGVNIQFLTNFTRNLQCWLTFTGNIITQT